MVVLQVTIRTSQRQSIRSLSAMAKRYQEAPITFVDAALGGELDVLTLDGQVKLKIPAETQTGKLFRLRGRGDAYSWWWCW